MYPTENNITKNDEECQQTSALFLYLSQRIIAENSRRMYTDYIAVIKNIFMGSSKKPRLNFTLTEENKSYIEQWAEKEKRSIANLLEIIVTEAIEKDKSSK
ncbi:MAG: hypothetical protein AAF378_24335 [Cyanobacteria bacterium P01_A01_bin.84]